MLEVNVLRSTRIHAMALLKYIVLLNTDVPRSARFYAHGLGLAVTVCSERWAELQSGAFRIALMQAPKYNCCSSFSPAFQFSSKRVANYIASATRMPKSNINFLTAFLCAQHLLSFFLNELPTHGFL